MASTSVVGLSKKKKILQKYAKTSKKHAYDLLLSKIWINNVLNMFYDLFLRKIWIKFVLNMF
jgi:hypothetical protein